MNKIDRFRGEYFFLSNFSPAEIVYNGIVYKNAEAAFQAQKTCDRKIQEKFAGFSAREAKRNGRKVVLRPDWDNVRDRIMEEILLAKFTQNSGLGEKLLATGEAVLIEKNSWNDTYWGVDEVSGRGENRLGRTLMKIRTALRK